MLHHGTHRVVRRSHDLAYLMAAEEERSQRMINHMGRIRVHLPTANFEGLQPADLQIVNQRHHFAGVTISRTTSEKVSLLLETVICLDVIPKVSV